MNARIAFFLPDLHAGGAEKVMLSLAGEVLRRGHAVDLVVGSTEGELSDFIPAGVRTYDLGASPSSASKLRFAWQTLRRLANYLRARRPDCLLSTLTGGNLTATVALIVAGKRSTSLLLREASSRHNTSSMFRRWLIRQLYPLSDACIAVSQGIYDDLTTTFGLRADSVHVIHNPVDVQAISVLASQPPSFRPASQSQKGFVIAAGRLKPEKGFDYLIREFHSIRDKVDLDLLILGEGPERRHLAALIADLQLSSRVNLPGYLDNPFPLMAGARLFVLSSQWEGFPNVLLQSLALGVSVVATDCHSGPAEILNNGEFGILIPYGKEGALAAAMLEALEKPVNPSVLRARASDYSISKITDRYLDLVRTITDVRPDCGVN